MADRPNTIVGKQRLVFANNDELRSYYEDKYRHGGYEAGGHLVHGVDVSGLYHQRRTEVAFQLVRPVAHEFILDAGCGSGALAARLAGCAREVAAIDIAANALDRRYSAIPNLHFNAMNIESLKFDDATFDAVVCVETLEHVLTPRKAVEELARVLKPGGRAVLTYPTINRTLAKRWRLGPRLPISEHLTEWSYRELRTIAADAALELEYAEGIAFDFGAFLGLKRLGRFFALRLTQASLALRRFPGNSLFIALRLRKR